jgi:hypothetical protein
VAQARSGALPPMVRGGNTSWPSPVAKTDIIPASPTRYFGGISAAADIVQLDRNQAGRWIGLNDSFTSFHEPGTQALADKLLQPLAAWDIGPASKAGSTAAVPVAAPAAPVAAPTAPAKA